MRSVGAAVVGTGFIGPVHVEAIRRLGHRVVGILGSDHNKTKAAADRLGLEIGFASLEELLRHPNVEVVHLASPNREHFEQCQMAMHAGKHVICEKPLAMTTVQTQELARLALQTSVVTAVNYNVRFYPMILDARRRFLNGEFGAVWHVTGHYLQDWLQHETDFNWRVSSEHGGELRAVADIGTHWMDTMCFIGGLTVQSVCADLQTVHSIRQRPLSGTETFTGSANINSQREPVTINTEDAGSILVRFTNGARGCLTVSQVTAGRKNNIQFELAGSRASMNWDSDEPNELRIGHRNRPNELVTRDPGTIGEPGFSDYPAGHAEGFPDTFKMLFRAIYTEIDNRRDGRINPNPLYATFDDGHREVAICEAILRSHRERRWVEIT